MKGTRAWVLLLTAALGGCAAPTLVGPGPISVDGLQLRSPVAWSQRGFAGERQWTIDGPLLNALEIYTEVKPGELLFDLPQAKRREGIRFREGMSELELQELVADGLLAAGALDLQLLRLQPARLRQGPAIEFEMSFANSAGLRYRALARATQADGTLTLLLYYAPAEYYFERDRGHVEAIFRSLE